MTNDVVVRGMTSEWFIAHFKDMQVYFGGTPQTIPVKDCKYVGFYLEAPDSAITHLGITDRIEQHTIGKTYYLNTIIKLPNPIKCRHAIRKHEYWSLAQLGIMNIIHNVMEL